METLIGDQLLFAILTLRRMYMYERSLGEQMILRIPVTFFVEGISASTDWRAFQLLLTCLQKRPYFFLGQSVEHVFVEPHGRFVTPPSLHHIGRRPCLGQ